MVLVSLPEESWLDTVGPVDGVELVVAGLGELPPEADRLEVVVPPYLRPWDHALLRRMPRLRLVQLLTAGYDGLDGVLPPGVPLANAGDVHATATAELAVALALAAQRGIPTFVRDQARGVWGTPPPGLHRGLADSRVLVVGYGSIGRAIAARLAPFEVAATTAVATRPRPGDAHVPRVHGIDELPALLPLHDVVLVVVPLNPSTTALVDDAFLAAMPDGALLVNVARGRVADTAALLRHAGRLRLALDVTDPEPLPPGHPLWSATGVLVSPHTGGASTAFRPRAGRLLREQLARVVRGEEPHHVVARG